MYLFCTHHCQIRLRAAKQSPRCAIGQHQCHHPLSLLQGNENEIVSRGEGSAGGAGPCQEIKRANFSTKQGPSTPQRYLQGKEVHSHLTPAHTGEDEIISCCFLNHLLLGSCLEVGMFYPYLRKVILFMKILVKNEDWACGYPLI